MVRDSGVKTVHHLLLVQSQRGEGWKGTAQATQCSPCHGQQHFPPEQLSQSRALPDVTVQIFASWLSILI